MSPPKRKFVLALIKPSHYDDDGYVIQWLRSAIPSNSLACLYGLAKQCIDDGLLPEDIELEVHAFDETNTVIHPRKIARLIRQGDAGIVMLVGVQSNQFPRALDLASALRQENVEVAIGGFHVSGTTSMLKERDPSVQRALDLGVTIFAGEAEGRFDSLLKDAIDGKLQPVYDYMDDLPNLEGAPPPLLPAERVKRTAGSATTLDAGRGCPFTCSFCTIINVQGRKSRRRSADDVELIIRQNLAQGLSSFFITDDNFARNKDWEQILDRLIYLREDEGLKISFIIQVDTLCHKLPQFIEKCKRAGVKRVFIGLENINPDSLLGAKKRQNKITDYRQMLLAWKKVGIVTYCGYILGFPGDTPESIRRDIEIIKTELPVDLLEFFYLTPLPGSEDHKRLHEAGVAMDEDLNKYDLNHAVTGHQVMSKAEWERAYHDAWLAYYTDDHVETILRRAIATGTSPGKTAFFITWFKGCIDIEGIHPLEGGFFRRKVRRNRRSELPLESPLIFYPAYWLGSLRKQITWITFYLRLRLIYRKVRRDPARYDYMDAALEPVTDHEDEREMFQSASAKGYLKKLHDLETARRASEPCTKNDGPEIPDRIW